MLIDEAISLTGGKFPTFITGDVSGGT